MAKILVVDDDAMLRDALVSLLEDEGYAVCAAADGCEALARLASDGPCVMVLDMMMPVMSGAEVLRALRSENRLPTVPVIAISAQPMYSDDIEGTRHFVKKPFDPDVLSRAVADCCFLLDASAVTHN